MKLEYEDLHSQAGLAQINHRFLQFVSVGDSALSALYLAVLKGSTFDPSIQNGLLIEIAQHLEAFLVEQFDLKANLAKVYTQASNHSLIAYAKRQFVQRYALKKFPETQPGWQKLYEFKDEVTFATEALDALEHSQANLDNLAKYAAWAVGSKQAYGLFNLPIKLDANFVLRHVQKVKHGYETTQPRSRDGFGLTDPGFSTAQACDQAHYCILCHNQGKDSCRQGLSTNGPAAKKSGCPLDQKISQMHALKRDELNLGALAVIMIDNPMVAATGHRICNDCMQACIFQKQDPVNTPGVETNILNAVLSLPYGFEIYSLLTRWNPLDFAQVLPDAASGYQVLIAGLGPAGFSLAHYLSRAGHRVIGIDGVKLEPLPSELLEPKLIKDVQSLYEKLDQRTLSGFGGVSEYGITVRWNKNYLKILRLLLERRDNIKFIGSTRYGSQITATNYRALGFDTVAICTGAGAPKLAPIDGSSLPGVRLASDFLMALQLTGAAKADSLANLQMLGPIIVIGGGLTAIDAATEAKAYYKVQAQKFRQRYAQLALVKADEFKARWTPQDHEVAEQLLACDGVEVRVIYRAPITNAPSYQLNPAEIDSALEEGIIFEDQAIPLRIVQDEFGWAKGLWVKRGAVEEFIAARSIIMAIGTAHESSNPDDGDFTFGDANPSYAGSVVKAIASAKYGYKAISQHLRQNPPTAKLDLTSLWNAVVISVIRLAPNLIQLEIKAPLAASAFQPGQFYRLQNFESDALLVHGTKLAMEALALTPVKVDKLSGLLTFVIVEIGSSTCLAQYLKPGELVSLMGPAGTPTVLPSDQRVLLIGGGQFNLALLHLAQALKAQGNTIFWIAGYSLSTERTFVAEIEAIADHLWWYCADALNRGNVLDGLNHLQASGILPTIDWLFVMGSTTMQQAVAAQLHTLQASLKASLRAIANANMPMQCMMQGICGQCLITWENGEAFCCKTQEWRLQDLPFEALRNRSQQNSLLEKISQQWLQYITETPYG